MASLETKYRTMQEIVYETIKESILSGQYVQGQRLITNDLANELGVSRMPVREALTRLEAATGLVSLIPHRGAIVNKLSEDDLFEVFQIRAVLEGLASRLACPHITNSDLEKLEQKNRDVLKLDNSTKEEDFQDLNLEFHSIIWNRTNSTRLKGILQTLYDASRSYRYISLKLPGRLSEIHQEHEEIIEALRQKDASGVEDIVKAHYQHTLDWLMKNKSAMDSDHRL